MHYYAYFSKLFAFGFVKLLQKKTVTCDFVVVFHCLCRSLKTLIHTHLTSFVVLMSNVPICAYIYAMHIAVINKTKHSYAVHIIQYVCPGSWCKYVSAILVFDNAFFILKNVCRPSQRLKWKRIKAGKKQKPQVKKKQQQQQKSMLKIDLNVSSSMYFSPLLFMLVFFCRFLFWVLFGRHSLCASTTFLETSLCALFIKVV